MVSRADGNDWLAGRRLAYRDPHLCLIQILRRWVSVLTLLAGRGVEALEIPIGWALFIALWYDLSVTKA